MMLKMSCIINLFNFINCTRWIYSKTILKIRKQLKLIFYLITRYSLEIFIISDTSHNRIIEKELNFDRNRFRINSCYLWQMSCYPFSCLPGFILFIQCTIVKLLYVTLQIITVFFSNNTSEFNVYL